MTDREREAGTIVVGVDGSALSRRAALEWALRQAEFEGAEVIAVQAWQMPVVYGSGAMLLPPEEFGDDAKAALAAAVEEVAAARPGVHIEQSVVEGNPAKVMIDKAKGADLLVVGSRGHGGFVGALIGSGRHARVLNWAFTVCTKRFGGAGCNDPGADPA